MSRRKRVLTIDDHSLLGVELARICSEMMGIYGMLARAYPLNHPACRKAERIARETIDLRWDLNDEARRQFPRMRPKDRLALYHPQGFDDL